MMCALVTGFQTVALPIYTKRTMLLLIAYLGGVLTIVSPCILHVLPFVFSRAGPPFTRSILPMLAGMAAMLTVFATLAAEIGRASCRERVGQRVRISVDTVSIKKKKDIVRRAIYKG